MLTLHLPPTLKLARVDEVSVTASNQALIHLGEKAKIAPGYRLLLNTDRSLPFRFFAEINVHNESVWQVFIALANGLPSPACLIYHHEDEKEMYSPYVALEDILNGLQEFKLELTQDCRLNVGLLHHSPDEYLAEVYLSCAKYLRYWGMDEAVFRSAMEHFSLPETADLAFIDEFPRVIESLSVHAPECLDTWDVLGQLLKRFGQEK